MPDVSFIIPVYNAADTIERCAASIFAQQNIHDYEVIFVNDGSSDESGEILERYRAKDSRVIVIEQNNAGVSAARNAALTIARGEYIQFLDADDWIPDHSTSQMLHAARENHADLVIGNFYRVDGERIAEKGSIKQNDPLTLQEFASEMLESPADFYYGVLWNKLYRNDIIQKYNIRMNEDLNYCEDFIFNLEYYLHIQKIIPLQVPVYYYVKTPGSLVNQLPVTDMAATKRNVFSYYNDFYKNILDEEEYRRERLSIVSFLLDAAKDQRAVPFMPGTQKLGKETVSVDFSSRYGNPLTAAYYMNKLFEKYCGIIADKYDLKLEDIFILYAIRFSDDGSMAGVADFTGLSQFAVLNSVRRLLLRKIIRLDTSSEHTALIPGLENEAINQDLTFAYHSFCETMFQGMSADDVNALKINAEKVYQNLRKSLTANVKSGSKK